MRDRFDLSGIPWAVVLAGVVALLMLAIPSCAAPLQVTAATPPELPRRVEFRDGYNPDRAFACAKRRSDGVFICRDLAAVLQEEHEDRCGPQPSPGPILPDQDPTTRQEL